jgi:sulfite exporter TauE/SafE
MISAAFLLGLITSLHCIGMCGPIALSLGLNPQERLNLYLKNITYQFGRITTYSILGLIIGWFGFGVKIVSSQQFLSVFVGIVMLIMVLLPRTISFTSKNIFSSLLLKVKLCLGKLLGKNNYKSLYSIGLLNGLLPCGPVYVALTAALASESVLGSGGFMFFFGLGTLPLMFLTTLMGSTISQEFRNMILKIYPIVLVILGILFILRGLELNIPYISPPEKALQINPNENCH